MWSAIIARRSLPRTCKWVCECVSVLPSHISHSIEALTGNNFAAIVYYSTRPTSATSGSPFSPSPPRATHLPRCCNRLICMQRNFRVNFATQRAMLKCTMRRKQPNNICICTKYALLTAPYPFPSSLCPSRTLGHPEPNCNAAVANGRI